MATKVLMIGRITGGYYTDEGPNKPSTFREYPGPGEIFETDDDQAARLIAHGMAVDPDDERLGSRRASAKVESATKPAAGAETATVDTKPGRR